MERISIFNYEAFYLDYLEGNLSASDTEMLMQFLEEHPECRLEEEELTVLEDEALPTYSGKKSLKQVDESDRISSDNAEHFIIADAEGILNQKKKAELKDFISDNEALKATQKRYASVYLKPDMSIVYKDKEALKQRKTIVLWPLLSGIGAAAAVVVFVFLTNMNLDSVNSMKFAFDEGPAVTENPVQDINATPSTSETASTTQESLQNPPVKFASNTTTTKEPNEKLGKMPIRKNGMHTSVFDNVALKPVNVSSGVVNTEPVNTVSTDPLMAANSKGSDLAKMTNPIAPVTKFISDKAKTEVDFKRRKASKDKKAGFFLKIGKFEIAKNAR
jgi:hypothetical protein